MDPQFELLGRANSLLFVMLLSGTGECFFSFYSTQ